MSTNSTVSEHRIIEFSQSVHVRLQQKKSRTKPYCMLKELSGKAAAYDGVGALELNELSGRYADIEFAELEHWRRKISKRRFGATLPIDTTDVESMLKDPEGIYADALANAAKRQFDRVVVEAMFADVKTGEDFDTTVTAANDGVLTVDATSGLTYEKLLEIQQNFIDNEVGNDDEDVQFALGVTGDEHTDLMSELELTSGDYSRQYVVDKGRISMAVGIHILKFAASGANGANPILSVTSGTRDSFCMATGAICVGIARQWEIDVQKRNDKYNTKQVVITGVLGAVRTEGKLIQKVQTTD